MFSSEIDSVCMTITFTQPLFIVLTVHGSRNVNYILGEPVIVRSLHDVCEVNACSAGHCLSVYMIRL